MARVAVTNEGFYPSPPPTKPPESLYIASVFRAKLLPIILSTFQFGIELKELSEEREHPLVLRNRRKSEKRPPFFHFRELLLKSVAVLSWRYIEGTRVILAFHALETQFDSIFGLYVYLSLTHRLHSAS